MPHEILGRIEHGKSIKEHAESLKVHHHMKNHLVERKGELEEVD